MQTTIDVPILVPPPPCVQRVPCPTNTSVRTVFFEHLDKLRTVRDDPYTAKPWSKKQDVWRFVKQLQNKHKLYSLRNTFGRILQEPEAVAAKIVQYWQKTMQSDGASISDCKIYLSQVFYNKNLPLKARILVRLPSLDLVEASLDSHRKNLAPGSDGIQASTYSEFRQFFVPLVHEIYQHILQTGQLNSDWSEALFNPMPKVLGRVGAAACFPCSSPQRR